MAEQEAISDGLVINEELANNHVGTLTITMDAPLVDNSDARSSSLSDYDEGYGENENGADAGKPGLRHNDVDSEAETERLDITPHQSTRLRNDIPTSDNEHMTTPSKSYNQYTTLEMQEEDSTSSSLQHDPVMIQNDAASLTENLDLIRPLSLSDLSQQSHSTIAGRKRKRTSGSERSLSVGSEAGKPLEKRLNSAPDDTPLEPPNVEVEEQVEEDLSEEDSGEVDNETSVDNQDGKEVSLQELPELGGVPDAPRKGFKPRKGKRKSKRTMGHDLDDTTTQEEQIVAAEQAYGVGEALSPEVEGEEADVAAKNEEELQRKRAAMDALAGIEEHFTSFRERLYVEKLNQVERELALLQQPNPIHPEYLLMMQCIDARYESQIQLEDRLLAYKLHALEIQTIAERSQIHSQYFQTVREIREEMLDKLGAELFRIQKERRQAHSDEPEYNYVYEPNRPQQILRQTKINKEVSLLSGIKKYQGFPAAPKLKGLSSTDVDDDLRAMKLNTNSTVDLTRHLNEPLLPERRAAEEFFAQTPWANAQHPAHQQNAMVSQAARPTNPFTTPAPQRRGFETHLPNGSGSTIVVPSDPPSSALAAGGSSHGVIVPDSSIGKDAISIINSFDGAGDSPLVHMKRGQEAGHNVPDEISEPWAQRRASVVIQGSPSANVKDRAINGRGTTADPPNVARETSGPEALGFAPAAGVKTEDEVHGSRLGFAMQAGHGQGQARQVGIAAGGLGR